MMKRRLLKRPQSGKYKADVIQKQLKEQEEASKDQSSGGSPSSSTTSLSSTPSLPSFPSSPSTQFDSPPRDNGLTARALYGYEGQAEGDLSFKKGDLIIKIEKTGQNWWEGELMNNPQRGIFPANYVTELIQVTKAATPPPGASPTRSVEVKIHVEDHADLAPMGLANVERTVTLLETDTVVELVKCLYAVLLVDLDNAEDTAVILDKMSLFILNDANRTERPLKDDEQVGDFAEDPRVKIVFRDPEMLDVLFEKMLDDLGMEESKRKAMRLIPSDKKKVMLEGQRMRAAESSKRITVEGVIEELKQGRLSPPTAEALKHALLNEPIEWVKSLLDKGGAILFCKSFNQLVRKKPAQDADRALATKYCACFKSFMNCTEGFTAITKAPDAFDAVLLSLEMLSERQAAETLKLLAGIVSISDDAHSEIARQTEGRLKPWFEKLVLADTLPIIKESLIMLINALVSKMPESDRLTFRKQFNLDNLLTTISTERGVSTAIKKQVEAFFKLVGKEEEEEKPQPRTGSQATMDKLVAMVKELQMVPELLPLLETILEHMNIIPKSKKAWTLVDQCVQSVAMSPSVEKEQFMGSLCEVLEVKNFSIGAGSSGGGNSPELLAEIDQLKNKVAKLEQSLAQQKLAAASAPPAAPAGGAAPPPPPGAGGIPPPPGAGGIPPPPGAGGIPPPPGAGGIPPPPPGAGGIPPPPGAGVPPPPPPPGGGPPPPPGGGPPPPPGGGPPPPPGGGPPPPPGGGPPPPPGGGPPPPPGGGPPPPPGGGPPPPPGGGPPPPPGGGPPPPPGGGPVADPKKPKVKPNKKLRGFNWQKMNYKMSKGTIWEGFDESDLMDKLDKNEIETLFGEKEKAAVQAANPNAKPKKVSLLEPKRAQNMSIMLSRFRKYTFEEIRDAVVQVDEKVMNLENVSCLKTYCPEPEESALCKDYDGDLTLLGQPELFIRCLSEVPMLKARLSAMLVKMSFGDKFNAIVVNLEKMKVAIDALVSSETLEQMLKMMLAIGNYINGSTPRGGAFGFKLTSLSKLSDTKCVSNPKETLLHYLIRVCDSYANPVLSITDELSCVHVAIETDPDQVQSDLKELNASMSLVSNLLNQVDGSDNIHPYLQSFFNDNQPKITAAIDDLTSSNEKFKEFLKKYGAGNTKYAEIMSILHTFLNNFSKTMNSIYGGGGGGGISVGGGGGGGGKGPQKGLMDNVLASLNAGNY